MFISLRSWLAQCAPCIVSDPPSLSNLDNRPMSDLSHSNVQPSPRTTESPTGWAIVVLAALLPFAAAYVIAGVNPDGDGQFIAAVVGLLILGIAVVVKLALTVAKMLHHTSSNDDWVYW